MTSRNYFCFFLIILLCFSCSKKEIEKSTINEVNLESQMIEAYKEGLKELKAWRCSLCSKKI
jgi:outer membrane protein assembly factor BamD